MPAARESDLAKDLSAVRQRAGIPLGTAEVEEHPAEEALTDGIAVTFATPLLPQMLSQHLISL